VLVQGKVLIQAGHAYVYVDLLQGVLTNPFGLNALLARVLVQLGAEDMFITATLANEALENILINRYSWVIVGGTIQYYQKF